LTTRRSRYRSATATSCDDYTDRVIVIGPGTDRVVWQYGATHRATGPGLLNTPDGADLAPPYSLLVRHRGTLATPGGP
jgi:hypothetical protein